MKRLNKSFLFLASSLYVTFKYLWSEELMLWCFVSNNTKTLFRFERALWKETCVYVRNACIDCVSSCGRMLVLGWVLVFRRWELSILLMSFLSFLFFCTDVLIRKLCCGPMRTLHWIPCIVIQRVPNLYFYLDKSQWKSKILLLIVTCLEYALEVRAVHYSPCKFFFYKTSNHFCLFLETIFYENDV